MCSPMAFAYVQALTRLASSTCCLPRSRTSSCLPYLLPASEPLAPTLQTRLALDEMGWEGCKMVPCTGTLLHTSVSQAVELPEPNWGQPAPEDWTVGGNWSSERAALFSGTK